MMEAYPVPETLFFFNWRETMKMPKMYVSLVTHPRHELSDFMLLSSGMWRNVVWFAGKYCRDASIFRRWKQHICLELL